MAKDKRMERSSEAGFIGQKKSDQGKKEVERDIKKESKRK